MRKTLFIISLMSIHYMYAGDKFIDENKFNIHNNTKKSEVSFFSYL